MIPSVLSRSAIVLGGLLVAACHATAAPAPAPSTASTRVTSGDVDVLGVATKTDLRWPKPEGWKSETIPFPLEFAPELPYRGVEELRFGPRFFDPSSATYFSYSFAWVLDDAQTFSAERLSSELGVYFAGLARAVNEERFDAAAHAARITSVDATRYRGLVRTVDAFGDGRALSLEVEGEALKCGAKSVLLLTLSPRPFGDATWEVLRAQRATFECPR